MTPAQVEEQARRIHNAASSTFWSQDEIFKLIYEAEKRLATDALAIEARDTSTSTVAGTQSYAVPSLCISIKRLEYNGGKLVEIDMRDDDRLTLSNADSTVQGTPQYYWEWNGTVYLRLIPSAVKTLKFYYYKLPTYLTTSSTALSIPTEYHADLIDYVVSEMAAKDSNYTMARYYNQKWEANVVRAVQFMAKKRRRDSFAAVKDEEVLASTIIGSV